jgi:manganese/zinc/iron transport system permease protein
VSALPENAARWSDFWSALTFQAGHNTVVVMRGTMMLGLACGVVGTFLLLRRRALVADALAHAALPGVCLGFLLATALGENGRSLAVLLPSAALTGLIGVACVQLLTTLPRVREEAAIGAVLSVFFAAGVVLLSVIQSMSAGGQAGINHFIFGQAATMRGADATLIGWMGALLILAPIVTFKELRLLCFDPAFARSLGWSTLLLDAMVLAMVTAVTVAGLHAVGAILMVALLIIPPVAARFWTDRLAVMVVAAAGLGAAGCGLGTAASAAVPHLPTGPAIVASCGFGFFVSLVAAPARGLVPAALRRRSVRRTVSRQHLLRAAYECVEADGAADAPVSVRQLVARRSWSPRDVARAARRAARRGELRERSGGWALTPAGRAAAERIVRAHRLWEHFLSTTTEVPATHIDHAADAIEHVLDEDRLRLLEESLRQRGTLLDGPRVPESIHDLHSRTEEP